MANQEQLDILKKGVSAWNEWLKANSIPGWDIDLSGADLSNMELTNIDFSYVNLSSAKLNNVKLHNANLHETNLCNADLTAAELNGADLSKADLSQAGLSYAELRRANLSEAKLNGARLHQSKLEYANLMNAQFKKADLSSASLNQVTANYTDFSEADLSGAVFDKADIWRAIFSGANLKKASFRDGVSGNEADFSGADLSGADLSKASLITSKFIKSNLTEADLSKTDLRQAELHGANLCNAKLRDAELVETDFSEADLRGADLRGADLVKTIFADAVMIDCMVYGTSVWDLQGSFKEQKNLVINSNDAQPPITTNNIKDAQFISLILDNPEIRGVLNTLTTKTVLILGRFADESRKAVLDALRKELRAHNLLPIVFDFERPEDKDFTETVKTLAGMCYFVIADVTSPKSSPLELQATVPDYQIPFVPIIQEMEGTFAMMQNLQTKYPWVLDTLSYQDADQLVRILEKGIIDRAKAKHEELRNIKKRRPEIIKASKFEESVS
jgi:uncharacterized protein YjbI with pentapeptide repeats